MQIQKSADSPKSRWLTASRAERLFSLLVTVMLIVDFFLVRRPVGENFPLYFRIGVLVSVFALLAATIQRIRRGAHKINFMPQIAGCTVMLAPLVMSYTHSGRAFITGTRYVYLELFMLAGLAWTYLLSFRERSWVFSVLNVLFKRSLSAIPAGFMLVIFIGTVLLSTPDASAAYPISLVDALFTATSATCVTGLIVLDTGTDFSIFGQTVILCLIQIGGLGLMTVTAFGAVTIGRRLTLKQNVHLKDYLDVTSARELKKTVVFIVLVTLCFELGGFFALSTAWRGYAPDSSSLFYTSAFHSISAFCNAGFSLNSDSLMRYRDSISVNLIFIVLIVFGGLGFYVLSNLVRLPSSLMAKKRTSRLHTHSRIVVFTSAVLILVGAVIFWIIERENLFSGLSAKSGLLGSLFQSVTARTAGFNTIDCARLTAGGKLLLMSLMFIGASPGSTGGGIKTVTFFVVACYIISILRGRLVLSIWGWEVPRDIIRKCLAVTIAGVCVVLLFSFLLLITEQAPFEDVMFETFSAFGTVGLSTGITPALSTAGRIIITILMFLGRVGPLMLTLAVAVEREEEKLVGYPTAKIILG